MPKQLADISADAEISASGAAGDAELFHSGLERRPFHAGRAAAPEAPNHPIGFPQRPQAMLALSGSLAN